MCMRAWQASAQAARVAKPCVPGVLQGKLAQVRILCTGRQPALCTPAWSSAAECISRSTGQDASCLSKARCSLAVTSSVPPHAA